MESQELVFGPKPENQDQENNTDGKYEIIGNSFRFKMPDGTYFYNRLDTIRAFVNGQITSQKTGKPLHYLRACKA